MSDRKIDHLRHSIVRLNDPFFDGKGGPPPAPPRERWVESVKAHERKLRESLGEHIAAEGAPREPLGTGIEIELVARESLTSQRLLTCFDVKVSDGAQVMLKDVVIKDRVSGEIVPPRDYTILRRSDNILIVFKRDGLFDIEPVPDATPRPVLCTPAQIAVNSSGPLFFLQLKEFQDGRTRSGKDLEFPFLAPNEGLQLIGSVTDPNLVEDAWFSFNPSAEPALELAKTTPRSSSVAFLQFRAQDHPPRHVDATLKPSELPFELPKLELKDTQAAASAQADKALGRGFHLLEGRAFDKLAEQLVVHPSYASNTPSSDAKVAHLTRGRFGWYPHPGCMVSRMFRSFWVGNYAPSSEICEKVALLNIGNNLLKAPTAFLELLRQQVGNDAVVQAVARSMGSDIKNIAVGKAKLSLTVGKTHRILEDEIVDDWVRGLTAYQDNARAGTLYGIAEALKRIGPFDFEAAEAHDERVAAQDRVYRRQQVFAHTYEQAFARSKDVKTALAEGAAAIQALQEPEEKPPLAVKMRSVAKHPDFPGGKGLLLELDGQPIWVRFDLDLRPYSADILAKIRGLAVAVLEKLLQLGNFLQIPKAVEWLRRFFQDERSIGGATTMSPRQLAEAAYDIFVGERLKKLVAAGTFDPLLDLTLWASIPLGLIDLKMLFELDLSDDAEVAVHLRYKGRFSFVGLHRFYVFIYELVLDAVLELLTTFLGWMTKLYAAAAIVAAAAVELHGELKKGMVTASEETLSFWQKVRLACKQFTTTLTQMYEITTEEMAYAIWEHGLGQLSGFSPEIVKESVGRARKDLFEEHVDEWVGVLENEREVDARIAYIRSVGAELRASIDKDTMATCRQIRAWSKGMEDASYAYVHNELRAFLKTWVFGPIKDFLAWKRKYIFGVIEKGINLVVAGGESLLNTSDMTASMMLWGLKFAIRKLARIFLIDADTGPKEAEEQVEVWLKKVFKQIEIQADGCVLRFRAPPEGHALVVRRKADVANLLHSLELLCVRKPDPKDLLVLDKQGLKIRLQLGEQGSIILKETTVELAGRLGAEFRDDGFSLWADARVAADNPQLGGPCLRCDGVGEIEQEYRGAVTKTACPLCFGEGQRPRGRGWYKVDATPPKLTGTGLALQLNFFNQVNYALWSAGIFDLSIPAGEHPLKTLVRGHAQEVLNDLLELEPTRPAGAKESGPVCLIAPLEVEFFASFLCLVSDPGAEYASVSLQLRAEGKPIPGLEDRTLRAEDGFRARFRITELALVDKRVTLTAVATRKAGGKLQSSLEMLVKVSRVLDAEGKGRKVPLLGGGTLLSSIELQEYIKGVCKELVDVPQMLQDLSLFLKTTMPPLVTVAPEQPEAETLSLRLSWGDLLCSVGGKLRGVPMTMRMQCAFTATARVSLTYLGLASNAGATAQPGRLTVGLEEFGLYFDFLEPVAGIDPDYFATLLDFVFRMVAQQVIKTWVSVEFPTHISQEQVLSLLVSQESLAEIHKTLPKALLQSNVVFLKQAELNQVASPGYLSVQAHAGRTASQSWLLARLSQAGVKLEGIVPGE